MSLVNISLNFIISVMFGFIITSLVIYPLVPGHTGCFRFLAQDQSSVDLSQTYCNIITPAQLGAWRDCSPKVLCLCWYLVPLLEALPGNKRWPVLAQYQALLGVFTRSTFIDSMEFPLQYLSILPSIGPHFQSPPQYSLPP